MIERRQLYLYDGRLQARADSSYMTYPGSSQILDYCNLIIADNIVVKNQQWIKVEFLHFNWSQNEQWIVARRCVVTLEFMLIRVGLQNGIRFPNTEELKPDTIDTQIVYNRIILYSIYYEISQGQRCDHIRSEGVGGTEIKAVCPAVGAPAQGHTYLTCCVQLGGKVKAVSI